MGATLTQRSIMDKIEHRVLSICEEIEEVAALRARNIRNKAGARVVIENAHQRAILTGRGYADAAIGRDARSTLQGAARDAYVSGRKRYYRDTAAAV